jgi:hypothetical protein
MVASWLPAPEPKEVLEARKRLHEVVDRLPANFVLELHRRLQVNEQTLFAGNFLTEKQPNPPPSKP